MKNLSFRKDLVGGKEPYFLHAPEITGRTERLPLNSNYIRIGFRLNN